MMQLSWWCWEFFNNIQYSGVTLDKVVQAPVVLHHHSTSIITVTTIAAASGNGPLAAHMMPCSPRGYVKWRGDNPLSMPINFGGGLRVCLALKALLCTAIMHHHNIGVFWGTYVRCNMGIHAICILWRNIECMLHFNLPASFKSCKLQGQSPSTPPAPTRPHLTAPTVWVHPAAPNVGVHLAALIVRVRLAAPMVRVHPLPQIVRAHFQEGWISNWIKVGCFIGANWNATGTPTLHFTHAIFTLHKYPYCI